MQGLTLDTTTKIVQTFRQLDIARQLQSDIAVSVLRKYIEGFRVTSFSYRGVAETAMYLDTIAALEQIESYAAGITALEESLNELSRTLRHTVNAHEQR